ncbi:MAG: PilZ domain-containing protein [Parvularculaceae bacterium]|nr:PilZ domain-containing protein [Parvularculaceae bacterium]
MSQSEQRRFRRISLDLPARVVVNSIDEKLGRLVNISPGSLAVRVEGKVSVGDAAVVYISGLDVIEGRVARVLPDGFALSFLLSKKRRQILIEQLMLRANPGSMAGLADKRAAPRHTGGDQRMVCRLSDGGSLFVKVLEWSVNGVSVDSPRKPPVGAGILIGRLRATVLRHTHRGFVALYDHPADMTAEVRPEPRLRAV